MPKGVYLHKKGIKRRKGFKRRPLSVETKNKIGIANGGDKNGMYRHGMTNSDFYRIWRIMKNRCLDKNRNYLKHGISVCSRWSKFENFHKDMYQDYLEHLRKFGKENTSIDRINNDGNYSPENCRWATKREQSNNRGNNLKFSFEGRVYTLRGLSNKYGVSYKNLFNRICKFHWPIERAIINRRLKKNYEYNFRNRRPALARKTRLQRVCS